MPYRWAEAVVTHPTVVPPIYGPGVLSLDKSGDTSLLLGVLPCTTESVMITTSETASRPGMMLQLSPALLSGGVGHRYRSLHPPGVWGGDPGGPLP